MSEKGDLVRVANKDVTEQEYEEFLDFIKEWEEDKKKNEQKNQVIKKY